MSVNALQNGYMVGLKPCSEACQLSSEAMMVRGVLTAGTCALSPADGRANLAAFRWLLMRHGSSARVGTERCIPRALLFLSPLMVLLALFMVSLLSPEP